MENSDLQKVVARLNYCHYDFKLSMLEDGCVDVALCAIDPQKVAKLSFRGGVLWTYENLSRDQLIGIFDGCAYFDRMSRYFDDEKVYQYWQFEERLDRMIV